MRAVLTAFRPPESHWNALYSDVTGMVDTTSVVATRSGADLTANPLGTPLHSYDIVQEYSLYFSDTWKIKPNLTLTYGLNWSLQMPPYDTNKEMTIMTDPEGSTINTSAFLANVQATANNGQTFNPTLSWEPIANVNAGEKYPYQTFYGGLGPRVAAIAWSPGGDNRIFGRESTVIRGGYAYRVRQRPPHQLHLFNRSGCRLPAVRRMLRSILPRVRPRRLPRGRRR